MEITEVRVKLVDHPGERLRGFCTITFANAFVVRDVKIIEGPRGLFVAMPSRKVHDRCPHCGGKNHLRASYCNDCGKSLPHTQRVANDGQPPARLHTDVAHPINQRCRALIESRVIEEYEAERKRAERPDYRPPNIDDDDDYFDEERAVPARSPTTPPAPPARRRMPDEEGEAEAGA